MSGETAEIEALKEISRKLDNLVTLFSVQGKEKEEQIRIMVSNGCSNSQIAKLLGLPKGTVDGIRVKFQKKK